MRRRQRHCSRGKWHDVERRDVGRDAVYVAIQIETAAMENQCTGTEATGVAVVFEVDQREGHTKTIVVCNVQLV
jgi:hypothetical protein